MNLICTRCNKPILKPGYLQFISRKRPICAECIHKMQEVSKVNFTITQGRYCTMDVY